LCVDRKSFWKINIIWLLHYGIKHTRNIRDADADSDDDDDDGISNDALVCVDLEKQVLS
jgi:hypothetical protein